MSQPGPCLAPLNRRLLETPADFQLDPWLDGQKGTQGTVRLDALVSDTLRWLGGGPVSASEAAKLREGAVPQQVALLRLVALACWLLHDPAFAGRADLAPRARALLLGGLEPLSFVVRPPDCVTDPDRREELVRRVLAALDLRPAEESENAARDRLTALDSVARARVAREAAEAEKRARAVREAAAKAAREAASYYGRE